jgi:hypothetical protein
MLRGASPLYDYLCGAGGWGKLPDKQRMIRGGWVGKKIWLGVGVVDIKAARKYPLTGVQDCAAAKPQLKGP